MTAALETEAPGGLCFPDQQAAIRLAEKLGAAIGWSVDESGNLVLTIYSMPASALIPACFGWDAAKDQLAAVSCPN